MYICVCLHAYLCLCVEKSTLHISLVSLHLIFFLESDFLTKPETRQFGQTIWPASRRDHSSLTSLGQKYVSSCTLFLFKKIHIYTLENGTETLTAVWQTFCSLCHFSCPRQSSEPQHVWMQVPILAEKETAHIL